MAVVLWTQQVSDVHKSLCASQSQVNTHKYAAIISYAGQLAIEPTSDEEIQTKRDEHHTSKELDRQVDDNR